MKSVQDWDAEGNSGRKLCRNEVERGKSRCGRGTRLRMAR